MSCPICKKQIGDQPTLHYAKCLINFLTTYAPIPKTKPYRNLSKLVDKIGKDALNHIARELPPQFYEDGNFPRLIKFVTNLLIFISENDGHYRSWLAWLLIKTQYELNQLSLKFDNPKAFYDFLAQHPTIKEAKK